MNDEAARQGRPARTIYTASHSSGACGQREPGRSWQGITAASARMLVHERRRDAVRRAA
jgi:hypothetical protein